MKTPALRLGIALLSMFIALVAVELFLRSSQIRPSFSYPWGSGFRIALDREVLYKVVPHSAPDINNYGYRDRDFEGVKRDKLRVLFLGDSFVMGPASTAEQTIPKQLERLLGAEYEVFNMGVYGYGPDQSLVQLMNEGLGFDPDLVILALFPSNDFGDIYKNELFRLDADGRLQRRSTNAVTSVIPRLDTFYLLDYLLYASNLVPGYFMELFMKLHRDTPDYDLYPREDGETSDVAKLKIRMMSAILGRFRDELQQRKIDFLTVILPRGPKLAQKARRRFREVDPYYNETVAAELARAANVPLLDLIRLTLDESYARLYAPDVGGEHLNAAGHGVVASSIQSYLKRTPP